VSNPNLKALEAEKCVVLLVCKTSQASVTFSKDVDFAGMRKVPLQSFQLHFLHSVSIQMVILDVFRKPFGIEISKKKVKKCV